MKNYLGMKNTWKRLSRKNSVWILGLTLIVVLLVITWKATLATLLLLGLISLVASSDRGASRGTYLKIGMAFYIFALILLPISNSSNEEAKPTPSPASDANVNSAGSKASTTESANPSSAGSGENTSTASTAPTASSTAAHESTAPANSVSSEAEHTSKATSSTTHKKTQHTTTHH